MIFDVASSLDDLLVLYRKKNTGVKASFTDPNIILDALLAADEAKKQKEKEEKEEEEKKNGKKPNKKRAVESPSSSPNPKPTIISPIVKSETPKAATPPAKSWEEDNIASQDFDDLVRTFEDMNRSKGAAKGGRNMWQSRQIGGEGEPFYRDAGGFERAIIMTIDHGRAVFAEKWGHRDCNLGEVGLVAEDAWRVERDW